MPLPDLIQLDAPNPDTVRQGFEKANLLIQEVGEHDGRTDNPHGATAAQVGAPTAAAFIAHVVDTGNPHYVTKAQVGLANVANDLQLKAAQNLNDLPDKAAARQALGVSVSPVGMTTPYAGRSAPSGWLLCYGQAVSRTTYADLFAMLHESATIAMTIATPCVVTWSGRTWQEGEPIKFSTTGTLPTGLVAGTAYYAKSPSGATCNLAATPGGTAINTSGSQSGTHTGICAPFGNGDGSTTFNVPDFRGRSPIGKDNLGGTSANVVTAALADALGGAGGAETHTLITAEMPAHNHTYGGSQQTVAGGGYTSQNEGAAWATSTTGGGGAHANMSPWLAVNWIIKT